MTGHVCPPDHKHGDTLHCHKGHGCSCDDCIDGSRARQFWYRSMIEQGRFDKINSRIDGRGARRRMQALMAIGWSAGRLGAQLGVTAWQACKWLAAEQVTRTTHARIAELYERLAYTPPVARTSGDQWSITRALHTAEERGYARPIDWDDIDTDDGPATGEEVLVDEVAVQLALEGTRIRLSREERHVAVTALNARRYNDQETADMLGVSSKTIARDREELGLPAHPEPYEERFAA